MNTRDPIAAAAAPAAGDAAPARPPAEMRARFRVAKAERLARFLAARPTARAALRLVRALANDVDDTLSALWLDAGMPEDAALVAVGGYGRGELFPYSDVDVLVLLPSAAPGADETRGAATERFITACWDAGLEIGSSVRTVDECVAMALSDVTVQTALLESRFLCGARRNAFASIDFAVARSNALNTFRAPHRKRDSSSAVCTVTSESAIATHSSTVRTLDPISRPASQHPVMKRSVAALRASSPPGAAEGSRTSTSTSE